MPLPGSTGLHGFGPGGPRDGDPHLEPGLLAQPVPSVVGSGSQVHEHSIADGLGAGVGVDGFAPEVVVLVWHGSQISTHPGMCSLITTFRAAVLNWIHQVIG